MSFFTDLRDAVESIGSVVGNFFLPGSSLITDQLVSKGAQELLSSPLGQIAQLGSGIAGGVSGNLGNYGSIFNSFTGGGTAGGTASSGGEDFFSGMSPGATIASQTPAEGADFFSGLTPQQTLASQGFNQSILPSSGGAPVQESSFNANGLPTATRPGTGLQGFFGGGIVGSPTSNLQLLQQLSGFGGMGGAGSMPWGSMGNLSSLGTGVYGLYQSEQLKKLAQQAAQQADPFGQSGNRALANTQLADIMRNPQDVSKIPGYQAGLDAVQRSMAAQGYQGSGNMMAALSQYGGQFYNNAVNQLGQLGGAGFNPASAGQLSLAGAGSSNNLALNSLGLLSKTAFLGG